MTVRPWLGGLLAVATLTIVRDHFGQSRGEV